LYERQCDPVDALFDREGEIAAVLLGQRRHRHDHVGNVQPLVVGQHAADLDRGDDLGLVMTGHAQHQLAVVEQQACAGFDRGEDFAVRQFDACGIARFRRPVEGEDVAGHQFHATLGEAADAQLRSLKIGKDRGGPVELPLEAADRLDHRDL
jgi:hypothetical protein